jgi:glycosyltransferase involved in cell wall biosynthesis
MRSYLPFALKRADAVICISKWTETTLCDRYPFVRDRIFVIPNGFPKRVPAAALESGAGPPRLVSVARGESYKQLGFLLSILRSMPSSVSLTLVTDSVGAKRVGEQGADLVHGGRLVVKMGLDKLQLQALVGAADVLVHTSLFEGFCLPACEALALGVPVVYRRGSGIDEVVDEGLGVGLAPDASSEDWADGIDRAISLRREKGFLARLDNSFAKHPSWDEVARLTRQVYDMLRA